MLGKKPTRKNRLKKNIRQRRRRWIGRLATGLKLVMLMVVLIAVSALFMAGYAAVTQSDYFCTQSIQIQGHSRLTRYDILSQAQIQPGDNLLAVNLRQVRKRLLAHPWIGTARVAREIPGTIYIYVTEHTPLAVVDLGRKFMVNTHGRIFKEFAKDDPQDIPLVTGIVYADISLGNDDLGKAMAAVVQVLKISRSKHKAIPYKDIRGVHLDPEMGITLSVWPDQRKIKLGYSQFKAKHGRLRQLLPHLKQHKMWRGFNTIDVNNPDRVVVQLDSSVRKKTSG